MTTNWKLMRKEKPRLEKYIYFVKHDWHYWVYNGVVCQEGVHTDFDTYVDFKDIYAWHLKPDEPEFTAADLAELEAQDE